ncbi:acid protease [Macrolepiota fuliginosa MF-IS2]|uniref:Acid protease n=1 Tax=Macrolepiota fuliginosa MF-IS2 TaxID=1400762 RepID=A0A9P6C7F1_9AGAR|nr:acid protease [Macrolepiota fuliginosa MF-IS2]
MLFPPVRIFVLVAGHLVGSTSARPASTRPEPTAEHRDSQNNLTTRTRGYDIPIRRGNFKSSTFRRRGSLSGESGLGDNSDLLYTVPIEVGSTVVAVNLDTGSSDLWIVSDACNTDACKGSTVTRYPTKNANSSGIDVNMLYGDSSSGTFAKGTIGLDTATIAGIAMTDQAFGMVNDTDNPVVKYDTAGIFGLGFPAGSKVQQSALIRHTQSGPINATDDFLLSTYTQGPLLSRILMTDALESPMFTITLHRNTIDISGKGQLTVGKLPDGVDNSSLTWVPVRLYNPDEGGLRPPTFAPNEIYPFRWEVDIDAVYLDGTRLPASTVPTSDGVDATRTSALIDTGNSIIRGPQDVVGTILRSVSPSYQPQDTNPVAVFPCNTPHTLSFQIGGQLFPIDPRDFVSQYKQNDATTCVADNLVTTDAPQFGALFRWSLGDPFFKSNLIAFHYGNLTHPSVDPPRIGFLSLVPPNVGDLYQQAVNNALSDGGNFEGEDL